MSKSKHFLNIVIIFFVIALFHLLFSVNFDVNNTIVNWQDMTQPLNPLMFLERSMYMWTSNFPWWVNSWLTAHLFYATPIHVFYLITNNIALSINIFWFFLHFFFLFSYFLLFRNLSNNKVLYGVVWSLLVYYSINTINILQFATVYVDYASYIWIPLLFFSLRKFVLEKKNFYILLFIFSEILIFRPTSIFLLANLLIFIYFSALVYKSCRQKTFIDELKRLFTLWITSILVLILPAFSLFLSAQRFIDSPNFKAYTNSWLSRVYQDGFALDQLIRLNWCGTCHREVWKEFPNLVFYKYSWLYNNSPFYIIISFIPILVIVSWLLYRRDPKKKNLYIPIFILVLVLLFFAKSINPPFASFNEYFRQLPVFWVFFRSWAKYFMFFIVPLIVFLWLQLLHKNRIYIKLAGVYILAHMLLIYVIHSPVGTYWKSTVPDTYTWIVRQINELPNLTNTLILPIANHRLDGQMYFRDWYAWSDRLYALTNSSLVYWFSVFWASEWYKEYFTDISKGRNRVDDYEAIVENMEKLWYSYILVERNAISYPRININNPEPTWEIIYNEIIQDTDNWKMLYQNEDFALFQWNESFPIVKSEEITVHKNNPTNYDLNIKIDNNTNLEFLQSYHPDWKLYIEPYSKIECDNPINYTQSEEVSFWEFNLENIQFRESFSTIECNSSNVFYTWWEFWKLQANAIFEDTHEQLYNYANSWKLNKDFIINNFSENYYKLNTDWSIEVKINLYFRSQSYFYILLLLSITTILIVVLWVILISIVSRKKSRV